MDETRRYAGVLLVRVCGFSFGEEEEEEAGGIKRAKLGVRARVVGRAGGPRE